MLVIRFIILIAFIFNSLGIIPVSAEELVLPKPGVMIHLSPPMNPPVLKGIKVHADNPFRFEFVLDKGDSNQNSQDLKDESSKLIKYFLASLTIPEKDLWVNLSPYEKDRIVPESFGVTEMGRDLLAEDYMLKQITASLIYPEGETGKKFWKRIYEEAQKKYGNTNIPVNTFNKVWIVPEKAVIYENAKAGTAYVVESKLKVMLEADYLSLEKHNVRAIHESPVPNKDINQIGSQIVREIVIPELTKEVNEGKNFSQLRQVYNSLILATWYKKKIKDSILSQVYADKSKTQGVNIDDPQEKEKIYQQYLKAFKKGVYNYIKDESDPITNQARPRKYFSGGFTALGASAMLSFAEASAVNNAPNQFLVFANCAMSSLQPVSSSSAMSEEANESIASGAIKVEKTVIFQLGSNQPGMASKIMDLWRKTVPTSQRGFDEVIEKKNIFIAYDRNKTDEPIGFISFDLINKDGSPTLFIDRLFVDAPFQGSGVSMNLLDLAIQHGFKHGATKIEWETIDDHVKELCEFYFSMRQSVLTGEWKDLKYTGTIKKETEPVSSIDVTVNEAMAKVAPENHAQANAAMKHSYKLIGVDTEEFGQLSLRMQESEQMRLDYEKGLIDEIRKTMPMGILKLKEAAEISSLRPDSKNIFVQKGILKDENGKYWILKRRTFSATGIRNIKKREMLAYLLFKGKENLNEIRGLSVEEGQELGIAADTVNEYYLSRIVTRANLEEDFPRMEKSRAFSGLFVADDVFFRKVDPHSGNLSFIDGIPVALDNDLTNLYQQFPSTEDGLRGFISSFLMHVIIAPFMNALSDDSLRTFKQGVAGSGILFMVAQLHLGKAYIRNEGLNKAYIAETILETKAISNVRALAKEAGYDNEKELDEIVAYIENNQKTLGKDTDYVWRTLTGEDGGFGKLDDSKAMITMASPRQNSDGAMKNGFKDQPFYVLNNQQNSAMISVLEAYSLVLAVVSVRNYLQYWMMNRALDKSLGVLKNAEIIKNSKSDPARVKEALNDILKLLENMNDDEINSMKEKLPIVLAQRVKDADDEIRSLTNQILDRLETSIVSFTELGVFNYLKMYKGGEYLVGMSDSEILFQINHSGEYLTRMILPSRYGDLTLFLGSYYGNEQVRDIKHQLVIYGKGKDATGADYLEGPQLVDIPQKGKSEVYLGTYPHKEQGATSLTIFEHFDTVSRDQLKITLTPDFLIITNRSKKVKPVFKRAKYDASAYHTVQVLSAALEEQKRSGKSAAMKVPLIQTWAEAIELLKIAPRINLHSIYSQGAVFRGITGESAFNDVIQSSLVKTDKLDSGGNWGDLELASFWATGGGRENSPGILFEMSDKTLETYYGGSLNPGPVDIKHVSHAYLMVQDHGKEYGPIADGFRIIEIRLPGMSPAMSKEDKKPSADAAMKKNPDTSGSSQAMITQRSEAEKVVISKLGFDPGVIAVSPDKKYAVWATKHSEYTYDYAGSITTDYDGPTLVWFDIDANKKETFKQASYNEPEFVDIKFLGEQNKFIVLDDIGRPSLWEYGTKGVPQHESLPDDLRKQYKPRYLDDESLKLGDKFNTYILDPEQLKKHREIHWDFWYGLSTPTKSTIFHVYIYGKRTFIVWNEGPSKGYIYQILSNPTEEAIRAIPSQFLKIMNRIDQNLEDMDSAYKKQNWDKRKEIYGNLLLYLREMDKGDDVFMGFNKARFYDDQVDSFMEEVDSKGLEEWLMNRAKELGFDSDSARQGSRGYLWDTEQQYSFFTGIAFDPNEPSLSSNGVFRDSQDPVELTHYTNSLSLPTILELGGIASQVYLGSKGIYRKSGEGATYTPSTVSFYYDSQGRVQPRTNSYSYADNFAYPIIWGVARSKTAELEYAYDGSKDSRHGLGMEDEYGQPVTVGGLSSEKSVRKFVSLKQVTHVFVPYFAIEEIKGLLKGHGFGHIQVLPLGFDKSGKPVMSANSNAAMAKETKKPAADGAIKVIAAESSARADKAMRAKDVMKQVVALIHEGFINAQPLLSGGEGYRFTIGLEDYKYVYLQDSVEPFSKSYNASSDLVLNMKGESFLVPQRGYKLKPDQFYHQLIFAKGSSVFVFIDDDPFEDIKPQVPEAVSQDLLSEIKDEVKDRIIFNGHSSPEVIPLHIVARGQNLMHETVFGQKFDQYWKGKEKVFKGLLSDSETDELLRLLVGEMIRNASERQDNKVGAEVDARVIKTPHGESFLRLEVRQKKIDEEQWEKLERNSDLSLSLLQDFYWRGALNLKENAGGGLASFSKVAMHGVPIRLEYDRLADGLVTTLTVKIDEESGILKAVTPHRDDTSRLIKNRLATNVWKEGWDILERNKDEWMAFYSKFNRERWMMYLADSLERFNNVSFRSAYASMAEKGYALDRDTKFMRECAQLFDQFTESLLKKIKSDEQGDEQETFKQGKISPHLIKQMHANNEMVAELEVLIDRTKKRHQAVIAAFDSLPLGPSGDTNIEHSAAMTPDDDGSGFDATQWEIQQILQLKNNAFRANVEDVLKREKGDVLLQTLQQIMHDSAFRETVWLIKILAAQPDSYRFWKLFKEGISSNNRFVRKAAVVAVRKLNTRQVHEALLPALEDGDTRVIKEALPYFEEHGTEQDLPELFRIMQGQPKERVYTIWNDHGSRVAFTMPVRESNVTTINLNFVSTEVGVNQERIAIGNLINVIKTRAIKRRKEIKKVDLEGLEDKSLRDFLGWLKEEAAKDPGSGLEDIVIIGGGVRDALMGRQSRDFDISVKVPLTDEEYLQVLGTTAQGNDRVHQYVMKRLEALAKVLGVPVNDFFDPEKTITWRGREIEYAGPIKKAKEFQAGEIERLDEKIEQDVFIKRALVDSNSLGLFSSSAGAAILQLALDCNGQLYGQTQAIDEILQGIISIVGDPINLGMGDILRIVRLQYFDGFALKLLPDDEELIKTMIKKYATEEEYLHHNFMRADVTARLLRAIATSTPNSEQAYQELESLGIVRLIESRLEGFKVRDYFNKAMKTDESSAMANETAEEVDIWPDGRIEPKDGRVTLGVDYSNRGTVKLVPMKDNAFVEVIVKSTGEKLGKIKRSEKRFIPYAVQERILDGGRLSWNGGRRPNLRSIHGGKSIKGNETVRLSYTEDGDHLLVKLGERELGVLSEDGNDYVPKFMDIEERKLNQGRLSWVGEWISLKKLNGDMIITDDEAKVKLIPSEDMKHRLVQLDGKTIGSIDLETNAYTPFIVRFKGRTLDETGRLSWRGGRYELGSDYGKEPVDLVASSDMKWLQVIIKSIGVAVGRIELATDTYYPYARKKKVSKAMATANGAMKKETGGIDLTSKEFLQTQNAGEGIKFHMDPAMLQQLQNAPGFYPVIINMEPMMDLRKFLGIDI